VTHDLFVGFSDDAIAILEAHPEIRLVFTDIEMPGSIDGLKLAQYVSDRWPPIKLIVASGKVPRDKALMDRLPPNTAVLDDTGPTEFPVGEYGGLKVKAPALEAAKKWNPRDDMSLKNACKAPSIIYAMQGPFPMEVFQGTEFIIFKLEYFDLIRIVFMDGRPHPPADFPHSKLGFSTGKLRIDFAQLVTDIGTQTGNKPTYLTLRYIF